MGRQQPIDFRAGADAAALAQEQALRAEMAALNDQILALRRQPQPARNAADIARLTAELRDREQQYNLLLERLQRQHPEAADLVSVNPATLETIQALLDRETTLVEYFVTDDRTFAFLVERDRTTPISLPVTRQQLNEAIESFYEYEVATLQGAHPRSLQQLHQHLIAPLLPHLKTPKLGIVAHNRLHYVPFAALSDGQHYLSDRYTLFNLPSASVLQFLQAKRKPGKNNLLALGNPTFDLAFARQEVETISQLYAVQPLLGTQAQESAVWAQASRAGILHLATHGKYDAISPLFSKLQLAPGNGHDGRLQVHEIYGLDLTQSTNLVVLSACQTQLGQLSRGDEWVGLNRAFLYAGTPSVVASLWNVDDRATQLLMERFYAALQAGLPKAKALQQAQQETRKIHHHPYYWAAFVLTGDEH